MVGVLLNDVTHNVVHIFSVGCMVVRPAVLLVDEHGQIIVHGCATNLQHIGFVKVDVYLGGAFFQYEDANTAPSTFLGDAANGRLFEHTAGGHDGAFLYLYGSNRLVPF